MQNSLENFLKLARLSIFGIEFWFEIAKILYEKRLLEKEKEEGGMNTATC